MDDYKNPKLLAGQFDIEAIRKDTTLQKCFAGFAEYFFSEIKNRKVVIWLRNNKEDDLVCIYNSESEKNPIDVSMGENSMIGGIAKNNPIFVLWPGYNNTDVIWSDKDSNTMAWSTKNRGAYIESELQKEKGHNVSLKLKETKDSIPKTVKWLILKRNKSLEDQIALFSFSYDGYLAIELDFNYKDLELSKRRIYMQDLLFRSSVRRFNTCITSVLNYYGAKKQE